MRSEQEEFVGYISDRCFGAPFTFRPAPIVKSGGREKEPFDLAWFDGRCLLAITMTHRSNKSLNWMVRHNLGGFNRWRRTWDSGTPLGGSNSFGEFTIDRSDVDHVLLLSVVGGANEGAEYHAEWVTEPLSQRCKVRMAATIPESVLHDFVSRSGTIRDLVNLAVDLEGRGVVEAEAFREQVIDTHLAAFERAKARTPGFVDTDDELFVFVRNLLILHRSAQFDHTPETRTLFSPLNDLDWEGLLVLLRSLYLLADRTRRRALAGESDDGHFEVVSIGTYDFVLSVPQSLVTGFAGFTRAVDRARELERMKPDYPPMTIIFPSMITGNPRRGPSVLATSLQPAHL